MKAKKSLTNKPTALEWILALSPIPVIGDDCARKVAEYTADQDEEFGIPYSNYNREENVHRRFVATRKLAYFIPFAIIAGGYILSQT